MADGSVASALCELLVGALYYQGDGDEPGVTIELMEKGDVGVVLSVLYDPFAEMDVMKKYGAPPDPAYFPALLGQLESVEKNVRLDARVCRCPFAGGADRRARSGQEDLDPLCGRLSPPRHRAGHSRRGSRVG